MKQAKTIIVILILMLIGCSGSAGQSSSVTESKGNISNGFPGVPGAIPLGLIKNGASVYPVGEVNNGATVYFEGVRSGAIVSL